MKKVAVRRFAMSMVGALLLVSGVASAAPTDAQKCEGLKLKYAGKYNLCRLKADAKAVKRGQAADYTRCDERFSRWWQRAEDRYGSACPTGADAAAMAARLANEAYEVATCLSGPCPPGAFSQLPATGQTSCWDQYGNPISCTGTGRDGEIQAGAALSYTDNGDGTITDNNTGLMWEKKDDDNAGSVHDWDGLLLLWEDSFSVFIDRLNNYCDDDEATPCTTDADCAGAPDTYASNDLCGHAGYQDWRVPNIRELESIIQYETYSPSVDPVFHTGCTAGCTVSACSCTLAAAGNYWSSTEHANYPTHAWSVDFSNGHAGTEDKDNTYNRIRAVRGGL